MSTKHTPKPWYAAAMNDALFVTCGEAPAADNDFPRHDAKRKAIFATNNLTCSFEEAMANTRLAAASPELLEACASLVKACDSAPPVEILSHISAACELVREAHERGEKVQWRRIGEDFWFDTKEPDFNPQYEWRIAPTDPHKRFRDALGVPGKRVCCRSKVRNRGWAVIPRDTTDNEWDDTFEYRVEKLIPWTAEDMKPGMWVQSKDGNITSAILAWDAQHECVWLANEEAPLAFGVLREHFTDVTDPKNPRECGRWVSDEEAK